MGWKLKIKHALGQIAMDLLPRSVDEPLVVGRLEDCDVQIPSTTVSRRHCLLYVVDDQWVVHDPGSHLGTFVNGQRISEPTILLADDTISLGEDPASPRLILLFAGTPVSANVEIAPSVASVPVEAESDEYALSEPTRPAPPQQQSDGSETEDVVDDMAEDESTADFSAAEIGKDNPHYYVPHRSTWSPGLISTLVGICLVMVLGTYIAIEKMREPAEEPTKSVIETVNTDQASIPNSRKSKLFNDDSPQAAPTGKPRANVPARSSEASRSMDGQVVDAALVVPAVPVENPEAVPAPAQDPRRNTETWQRVEEAHRTGAPVESIWIFESYRMDNPKGPFLDEVSSFADQALDQLWWVRVKDLQSQIETTRQQIVKLDDDIRIENEANYKKKLQKNREELSAKMLNFTELLTKKMGYTSSDTPDLYDPAMLEKLRSQRDDACYTKWKKETTGTIKYTRGRRAF